VPTARRTAQSLGVPLAFLYADTDVLAEAILTLGLLSKSTGHVGRRRVGGFR